MHKYNIKYGATPKFPPTEPPVSPPTHFSPVNSMNNISQTENLQLCQHPNRTLIQLAVHQKVPSTPVQQDNLQEFILVFDNLGTSQHIECPSPQVINTQEGVETVILQPPQCTHPATNYLDALANQFTTITTDRIQDSL